ncbi:cardiolipin synthase [Geobacter hydrogenophilus]|uniref:Cardiolipin synthase n=1 Tax=Geobacter hydrogenophilus TaxID=40983 RepID=A0A9W6G1K3_9BACT|nr:cardiolipin synthase [Geobacter hydrogenophilus]MBT0892995.1 cardiolipin synthase [Geobacter hydrogenophilus]GLI39170.1 cardiolipin synthase B [Geobacter hydrogenophilus]
MLTLRLPALFIALACVGWVSGCARLPDASAVIGKVQSDGKPPRIASIHGLLSPTQSSAIIKRLTLPTGPTEMLERQVVVNEAVSGSPLIKGNRVTLLVDGPATYAAMFKAIERARHSINMETFIFEDDETGRRLADLLIRKREEGVKVNLIYDSVGCLRIPASFFKQLRHKGVNVVEFNPVNPLKTSKKWRLTLRDHRKILVVDGSTVITGGVNISRAYSSKFIGEDETSPVIPWRDTDILIEGPAAVEFQKAFLRAWAKQKGRPALDERDYFPSQQERGTNLVQVITNHPGEAGRTTFIMYVSAVAFAEKSIHLTASYFVPDGQMIQALRDAARSGVDVKIILPKSSDQNLALYAGRYYYDELLEAGVKLYERRNAVLHAKTAVIDGVWATVGSTNLDFLSFSKNFEINTVVLGSDFAAEMERMFERDLAESDQIIEESWEKRPWSIRAREWFSHLFSPML